MVGASLSRFPARVSFERMLVRTLVGWVLIALLLPATASAAPARPKRAAAKAAATAWVKALLDARGDKPDYAKVAAQTSASLRVAVFSDSPGGTCDATITEPAKLAAAFTCILAGGAELQPLVPYSPKLLKELWDPLREHKDEIAAAAKTHEVFVRYAEGEDITMVTFLVVNVDADKQLRISAVYSSVIIR